ncbi:hypothetical protein BP5796_02033 [Coleophoma crateriformis]|uniref:Methyltransferase domain-containing protein n=1 Tax=Coleophoma crateriformis TaxID=565419 RepID=A0A3D8T2A7_9HELO|nr:hypothetical protein BP5796_02033 [Coleophoma crateriformis]
MAELETMNDDNGIPLFAFQDLDYIPFGYGTTTAPYIETSAGTMRAAAALMRLGAREDIDVGLTSSEQTSGPAVVCDLGSGDGEFLIGLLGHIDSHTLGATTARGIGVDYNAELIKDASTRSISEGINATWIVYDFNNDEEDLASLLMNTHHVTHVFIYLVPKQLMMQTVRRILTRLCASGVVVCCHKFFPAYLTPARCDTRMELMVYDETS